MHTSGSMCPVMRRASVALLFLPLAVQVVVGQLQVGPRALPPQREIIVSTDRVDRLERWVKAVDEHEPGEVDDPAREIGRFSDNALRDVWVDAQSLVALIRDRRTNVFQAQSGAPPVRTRIVYKPADLRRMRVLACAAAGLLDDRDCVAIDAKRAADRQAAHLAEHAVASRQAGDEDNYLLRRAALLHADVAMLALSAAPEPASARAPVRTMAPQSLRVTTSDGIDRDVQLVGVNWDIGRKLLDAVRMPDEPLPHPERDRVVHDWYRATSAWMILTENHDTKHLDRARQIFPDDRDILFLSGCQHEAYARPLIQSAVRTAVLPTGFAIDVDSAGLEFHRAESFFRRALSRDAAHAEARLAWGAYSDSLIGMPTPPRRCARRPNRSRIRSSDTTATCSSARKRKRSGGSKRLVPRMSVRDGRTRGRSRHTSRSVSSPVARATAPARSARRRRCLKSRRIPRPTIRGGPTSWWARETPKTGWTS
jgi:hypothetical protein